MIYLKKQYEPVSVVPNATGSLMFVLWQLGTRMYPSKKMNDPPWESCPNCQFDVCVCVF